MKVEIKNVKYSKFASQETNCFEATVYIDGKKEGMVSNSGQGGCNMYHPSSLGTRLDEYARTLPDIDVSHFHNDGGVHTMKQSADTVIDDLLEKALQKKRYAKKTLYRIPGFNYSSPDEFHEMKCKFSPEVKAVLVEKYGEGVRILNEEFE